ncbi:cobalamin biosynthesis protein, partial [Listeria monocytogenes]|uniref:cobalamin biosynthesis protein n=1 Tax=Listeria monocytogenes TaxID=1639 RepID=UPI003F67EDFA
GVIAPLFYLFIGGPLLALMYKAVNTLDSMVGYKYETYRAIGFVSAKMDDVVNFIPASLSWLFLVIASFILRYNGRASWRV